MTRRQDDPPGDPDAAVTAAIPVSVRVAGAWSWRVLGVLALAAAAVWVVVQLHVVVIPVAVGVLLSGLLTPLKLRLVRAGWPRVLAAVTVFLGLLVVVAGLVTLVVLTIRSGLPDFESRIGRSYDQLLALLRTSPLGFDEQDLQGLVSSATEAVRKNSGSIVTGALTGVSTVGEIAVGLLLALFTTLFFTLDGPGIWRWCVRLAPARARAAVDGAGRAAWISVGEYVRVQILVALIDAVGIGLVAVLLGLPFWVPIAVLVFLSAFIPVVGAVVTGALAVLIALVYPANLGDNTLLAAVIMLAGVIGVNQLESHVLQPLLMGNAVRLHPVAVVLAVATGSLLGGIAGAVFAVPLTAAANSAVKYVAGGRWKSQSPPTDAVAGDRDAKPSRRRDRRPRPKDVTTIA